MKPRSTFIFSCLCFGFAFLYIPILTMIAWSFNDSRLMSVWTGFSLRWYASLWENEQVIDALFLSLRIAFVSATFATVLGTLAALAMTRMGRFRGRTAFSGMLAAPLVMPEVITGLSLLMLFVSLQVLIGCRPGAAPTPSPSRTLPSAWPTWRWWCSRGWLPWTARWKKRPWISAGGPWP